MRILKEIHSEDIIKLSDVNEDHHIIVIKYSVDWCILIDKGWGSEEFEAHRLTDQFTRGNTYDRYTTLDSWITAPKTSEAHAFNSFKEACEFLITVL